MPKIGRYYNVYFVIMIVFAAVASLDLVKNLIDLSYALNGDSQYDSSALFGTQSKRSLQEIFQTVARWKNIKRVM